MTSYLYKMGIIKRNEYLDINGDFLRGSYLGHTGKRTQAVVQYCQGMVLFLDANSGLRSRISLNFHFQPYTPHELAGMMNRLAYEDQFQVEKDVWIPLQRYVQTRVMEPHFGNARFIRSFWQAVKQSHIMNFASGKYGAEKKYVVTLADV